MKEFAKNIEVISNSQNQPIDCCSDWDSYKNGSKEKLFTLLMNGNSY